MQIRFVADRKNYENIENNPSNGCFCNNVSEWCGKYSGLYNMSECQYGAPILLSWPHFSKVCFWYIAKACNIWLDYQQPSFVEISSYCQHVPIIGRWCPTEKRGWS